MPTSLKVRSEPPKAILPARCSLLEDECHLHYWPHFFWARGSGPLTVVCLGKGQTYRKFSPGSVVCTLMDLQAGGTRGTCFLLGAFSAKQASCHHLCLPVCMAVGGRVKTKRKAVKIYMVTWCD